MEKIGMIVLLLLVGCQSSVEKYSYEEYTDNVYHQPDYFNYEILEITSNTIEIGPQDNIIDASYATYEILVNNKSKIEGTKTTFSSLEVEDQVDVWVIADNV